MSGFKVFKGFVNATINIALLDRDIFEITETTTQAQWTIWVPILLCHKKSFTFFRMFDPENINELPTELIVLIFRHLTLGDVVKYCLKVCQRWNDIAIQYFISNYIQTVAILNSNFKNLFLAEGWTSNCDNQEIILKIWNKFNLYQGIHSVLNIRNAWICQLVSELKFSIVVAKIA